MSVADDAFSCFDCLNEWQRIFRFECAQHGPVWRWWGGVCRQYVPILTANKSKCSKMRKKCKQKPHNRTETFNWLHTFALMFHRTRISRQEPNTKKKRNERKKTTHAHAQLCHYGHWIRMRTTHLNKYIGNMFLVSSSTPHRRSMTLLIFCIVRISSQFVAAARSSYAQRECCMAEVWTIARRVTQSILTTWQSIRRSSHTHTFVAWHRTPLARCCARQCPFNSRVQR